MLPHLALSSPEVVGSNPTGPPSLSYSSVLCYIKLYYRLS